MDVRLIVVGSIALQFAAAVLALRLIPVTGRKKAWMAVSGAIFLMALRRSITFFHLSSAGLIGSLEISAEWVAFITSALMFIGIVWIAPIFRGMERSARKLQQSERRYRTLFEDCKDPVYITSREGRFVDINQAGLDLFGFTREEMIGMDVLKIYAHPEDRPRFQEQIERCESVKDYEVKFVKKDGTVMDCLLTSTLQHSDDGSVIEYRGLMRDVTVHKRMTEVIETERKRFFSLLEKLPASVDLRAPDHSIRFANQRFRETFGDPEGRPCHEIFHGKDVPCDPCALTRVFEAEKPRELEWIRSDGHAYQMYQYPYADLDGSMLVLELGIDITDRKRAEEALRESENKFRCLTETAASAIVIYRDEKFVYVNEATEAITGYSKEELLAMDFTDLVHSDFREIVRARAAARLRGEEAPSRYEFKIVTRSGEERWLDGTARRIEFEGRISVLASVFDITHRKRVEESLQEKQSFLEAVVETTPCLMVLCDSRGRIVLFNRACEELTGYGREEVIGKAISKLLLPPDWIPVVLERFKDPHAPEVCVPHENPWLTRSGEERLIEWRCTALPSSGNGGAYFLGIGIDVTEQRQIERDYRAIVENAAEGIFRSTPAGAYIMANQALADILGYESPDQLMASLTDIRHQLYVNPEKRDEFMRMVEEEGSVQGFETQFYRKDGSICWVSCNVRAVYDRSGTLLYYEGINQDITGRKQAEEERMQLVTAIEQAAEGVLIIDRDERILYVNPAFENISGCKEGNLIGRPLGSIGDEYYEETFRHAIKDCFGRGEAWSGHFAGRKASGATFQVEASLSPVRSGSGAITHCVVIERDVTNEAKLARQLRQAQKMEALGTLAGGIAHDFNNILGIIFGYTELALLKAPKENPCRGYLENVCKAAHRAKDLVQQILAFSRQGEQERQPIAVCHMVKEALKMIRASLPSTIEIREDISAKGVVLGDPTQIHQILMNLCTNAAHAMREHGGVLSVSLTEVELDEGFVHRHQGGQPGRYMRLSVSDTGHGMDGATLERIFDPYFTTKGPNEGTGLGLAVVHGIVQSHDGIITLYSEPGKGSSFDVLLPSFDGIGMGVYVLRESKPLQCIPRGSEHILFVDDEDGLCKAGRQMLENLGYRVTIRTSSIEALEAFRAQPDRFDLVVTDLTMPRMTGLELAKELHHIRPDVLIILCTGFSGLVTPERAKAAGVFKLATKPMILEDLAGNIRRALDGKQGESRPLLVGMEQNKGVCVVQ